MTAIEGRQITLKEVIDFCEAEMNKQEIDPNEHGGQSGLHNPDRFFQANEIKTHCELLLNQIKQTT